MTPMCAILDASKYMMTLNEAIEHCKEKSSEDGPCGEEHKQLMLWLQGYRDLLQYIQHLEQENNRLKGLVASYYPSHPADGC